MQRQTILILSILGLGLLAGITYVGWIEFNIWWFGFAVLSFAAVVSLGLAWVIIARLDKNEDA